LASPIITSIVEPGTPAVQFVETAQAVLVVPFQDVVIAFAGIAYNITANIKAAETVSLESITICKGQFYIADLFYRPGQQLKEPKKAGRHERLYFSYEDESQRLGFKFFSV
jgi:hypothetical protein